VVEHRGLGRLPAPDARDRKFPLRAALPVATQRTSRYWNANGWWGDQGATSQCVAYSWTAWIEDGPVTHAGKGPVVNPPDLYREAQLIDEWPGEGYDGTSVRAGARVLQSLGLIESYLWAFSAATVVRALLEVGPVVVGVNWYEGFDSPDPRSGQVHVTGGILGGHAFKLDGVNVKAGKTGLVRAKNSWGREWGQRGFFWLEIADLERLIHESGEACLAVERRRAA
jgi:hypothetical protein